jgi:mannitol-specific phosphotransferase system IIBC component
MFKMIDKFFDHLEDRVRGHLSHYPIIYAFVAGIGIVLFWRGVWHTADLFAFMTGPMSTIIGVIILLMVGAFVSFFIGDSIIIAGIKREKKLAEKTETEIETEKEELDQVRGMVKKIGVEVEEIRNSLEKKNS